MKPLQQVTRRTPLVGLEAELGPSPSPAAQLVFLPGAGGRVSFWRPVADQLADLGSVQVFGWPGFGDVPAHATTRSRHDPCHWLLARLAEGSSHVIAQAMGGILAVRLALDYPERLVSLVLVATSGGIDVARLGGVDWRPGYLSELPRVPKWFAEDR